MVSPYHLTQEGQAAVKARAEQLKTYLQSRRVARVRDDLAQVVTLRRLRLASVNGERV